MSRHELALELRTYRRHEKRLRSLGMTEDAEVVRKRIQKTEARLAKMDGAQ